MNPKSYAPLLVWMTGHDGQINFINSSWLEHTGKTLEQTKREGWLEDIHPDDRGLLVRLISTNPAGCSEHPVAFRLKQASGGYSPAVGLMYPCFHSGREFAGWAGSAVFISGDEAADAIFRLISNNMREIVCLISADTRILFISPAVESILGYAPEEMTGKTLPSIFQDIEENPEFKEYLSKVRTINELNYLEIRLPRKTGEMVWLEMDLQFLRDENGSLINLQIVARDVTIRKQNEDMLRLQNEIATALWETADLQNSLQEVLKIVLTIDGVDSGGVYVADPDSGHLDLITQTGISPAFADAVSHYPPNHPLILMARSGQPLYANFLELARQVEGKPPEGSEGEDILGIAAIPMLYKKELIAIFNLASHTTTEIPIHSRKILEFLAIQIGALIARNRTETAFHESEEKFRSFFEQATDNMTLVDEEGLIIEWNPASEALTGLSKAEVIGRSNVDVQFDLLPPAKKTASMYRKMEERYARIRRGGNASFLNQILEGQILDKKGRQRYYQQMIFPIHTTKGTMLGSSGRDVTQLKMIEKAELEQRNLTEALIVSSSVLNRSLKLDEIYQNIFSLAGQIVTNDGGSLLLINPETGMVKVAWTTGSLENYFESKGLIGEFPLSQFPALLFQSESTKPLLIEDIQNSRLFKKTSGKSRMHSFLGVPICANQKVIGFLNLLSAKIDHFEEKHAEWLVAFANQAALAIENARLFSKVEQLAVQDELTHVYNRRGLMEISAREVERAVRFNHPLAALFLDIDHFKEINDTYSHAVGDQVLQAVASCFGEMLRSVDVIGRYGGEEFVFLLPETDLDSATMIAERLRSEIEKMTVASNLGELRVTVSIGVSCLSEDIQTLEALLDAADAAVHRAKAAGRNRVEAG